MEGVNNMKVVNVRFLFVFLLVFFVSACGGKNTESAIEGSNNKNPTKLPYQILPVLHNEKSVTTVKDEIGKVYKKEKQLVFSVDGKQEVVISEQINSRHYWLSSSGDFVYVFWWEKFANKVKGEEDNKITGKIIYARSSQDGGKTFGDKKVITRGGGVLSELKIVSDSKGHVNLAYLDERFGGFNIFTNSSQDGGKTWKEKDFKIDHDYDEPMTKKSYSAVSPNLTQSGNLIIAAWQQLSVEDDKQVQKMYSRTSTDYGKTWEPEELVFSTDKTLSFEMDLHGDKKQAYLIAGMQDTGVHLFTKTGNKPWQKVEGVLPNSDKGRGGSYYRVASNDKYFYITYVFTEKVEGNKAYWHTEIARLDIAQNKWMEGSFRFDSRGMGVQSKGAYQDITLLDDGTIVVVWEDFRRILPMMGLNYSIDMGKTWLNTPLVISRQDVVNNSEKPFIRKLGNKFTVFYSNNLYPEQVKPELKTIAVSLISPKSSEFNNKPFLLNSTPSSKLLTKKLTERYKLLEDARLNKKWKQGWIVQDPLYRNLYKKRMWLRTRDRLIYKKFDLDSVKLDFPYGYTLGEMIYDLDPDFIDAKPNDPRFSDQKKKFVLKWGWFVDDWYLITETGTEPYLP